MQTDVEKLNRFYKKNPGAALFGFCDRTSGGDFRVIILARVPGKAEAATFVAATPRELARGVRRAGWHAGSAATLERLCNDAPNSRKWRPGNPGPKHNGTLPKS